MTATLVYKRDHTRRIYAAASNDAGVINISGCTIEVKLIAGATLVTLSLGSGVALSGATGTFSYDVTAANLVTLGSPDQVTTIINIWNADNTLLMSRTGVMAVTY
jgi:hypothetical protein